MELSHYPLVLLVVVGRVVPEAGLPVLVRGRTHHELVLLMVFPFETQLANLDMLTDNALESGLENEGALAAIALEASLVLGLLLGLDFDFFGFFLTELLGLLFEFLEGVRAPVRPAQRACDLLSDAKLVFDPDLDAVDMNVAAAAGLAECEVFGLLHLLVAHTAHLLGLELHAGDRLLRVPFLVTLIFFLVGWGRVPPCWG